MKIARIVPNIASEHFAASRDFYVELSELVVSVELDEVAPGDRLLIAPGEVVPLDGILAGGPGLPGPTTPSSL